MSKPRFVALLTGNGEGCDYTICCNVMFKDLESKNMTDALEEAAELYSDYGGEELIESIEILDVVASAELDIEEIERLCVEAERKEEAESVERAEREQYERLKRKFNQ